MGQKRAAIFLGGSGETQAKPLMLENVLFCPILAWVAQELDAEGVERFFVVCGPEFAEEARSCFPGAADVTVSNRHRELLDFVSGEGRVTVIARPVVPAEGAGEGYIFSAEGAVLAAAWKDRPSNYVLDSRGEKGWVALGSLADVQNVELPLRDRIVRRHMENGVRFLDPAAVYLDPRAEIGQGTMILPGTILQGAVKIGESCQIGPNALIESCAVGDFTEVNASQLHQSTVGDRTHVGPFAYVRPGSHIGSNVKVGDFVEVKNSTVGDGTKISHLTYVGDSDVGERVNFGCGTVTTNYDGFHKYRCTIEDDAFIGCNTNLVAPVRVGARSYIAAGATVTQDVPPDALAVARVKQSNKEGWAARRRRMHEKD